MKLRISFILLDPSVPKILIIGRNGTGKSTLGNTLLGEEVSCQSCKFHVCSKSMNLCTKNTTYLQGQWLRNGKKFTVVDTPGKFLLRFQG